MLTPAISKVREFLGSWKNLLAIGSLPLLGAWIFSRVWMVNPAILGDEYLYSMNARKVGPWDPPVAGDFSNYLFNFVYQGTNFCGDSFYSCTKVLNIFFFLGFALNMFVIASRFLPFWGAYAFMLASGLSPLSIYTSMFLPESMFFFFISLVLLAVLRAVRDYSWQNWFLVGLSIGVASLVKPHAWLSAIPIGIVLLVVLTGAKEVPLKRTVGTALAFGLGAALGRSIVGFIIAGPKALGFFGQYLGASTLAGALDSPILNAQVESPLPQSPAEGVFALFGAQMYVHSQTVVALLSISLVGLVLGIWNLIRTKSLSATNGLSLVVFIWLISMIIEIVIFTGWVTGSGDDHTGRVLLRYYEFLLIFAPLAALASFRSAFAKNTTAWIRWTLAVGVGIFMTPGFTGFFGTLGIQIADAPSLAGLVVDANVFNGLATVSALALLLFAVYPRWSVWGLAALLPFSMIAVGWQIQDQYQLFRAQPSSADRVGQQMFRDYSPSELAKSWVIGTSRFEATNVAFWADSADLQYAIFPPGYVIDSSLAPDGTRLVVALGGVQISGYDRMVPFGDDAVIFELSQE